MRRPDLAVLVLQEIGVGAVQHPRRAACGSRGEARGVAPGLDALTPGLDPDQLHRTVPQELSEQAERVASAAHARNGEMRQLSRELM